MKKSRAALFGLKSTITNFFSQSKLRLAVFSFVVIACFVTGIVIFCSTKSFFPNEEFILGLSGVKVGIGAFFSRGLSATVILGVGFVCSLSVFSLPIGVIIISLRGYLLGYNICALCSGFGLSGLLQAIFIILPCQIAMLGLLTIYLAFISKANRECKKFGPKTVNRGKITLIFVLLLWLVNLVETLLLVFTSAKVILVI